MSIKLLSVSALTLCAVLFAATAGAEEVTDVSGTGSNGEQTSEQYNKPDTGNSGYSNQGETQAEPAATDTSEATDANADSKSSTDESSQQNSGSEQ